MVLSSGRSFSCSLFKLVVREVLEPGGVRNGRKLEASVPRTS